MEDSQRDERVYKLTNRMNGAELLIAHMNRNIVFLEDQVRFLKTCNAATMIILTVLLFVTIFTRG